MSEITPSTLLEHGMRPEVASRRISSFSKRFGQAHLYLAYHAAFPLALTPDLLYRMWANFQRDIHGKRLNIPWVAVADLLLSSLCEEVGHELYEMDVAVRNALLSNLRADPGLGGQRINELSDFLLAFVKHQLHSPNPAIRDFAKVQRWTALAYMSPGDAALELALALRTSLEQNDKTEQLRMASLAETFAEPLTGFTLLLTYARGVGYLARGDIESAITQFRVAAGHESTIQFQGIHLPIPEQILMHLLGRIGDKAVEWQRKVEFPYRHMAEEILPEHSWWSARSSTAEGIRVPLGPISAKRYQYVEIGKGPANHMLILGTTGTGKTNLLHVLITSLALMYSPDELEMYLVDFKVVSFPPYVNYGLPHARVVAIHAEQEFGMSVLRGVVAELHKRQALFKRENAGNFTQYRQQHSLPRILLIIDEFQDLFTSTEQINQEAEQLLTYLVREGRGFGIHIILASQTLIGGKTHPPSIIVPRTLIEQMIIRIALNVGTMDAGIILDPQNPMIPLLPTFREGEALYNNQHGAVKGNYRFQCALLPEDELRLYLTAINDLAKRHHALSGRQQVIFDGSKNTELSESLLLNEVLQVPTWSSSRLTPTIWVGNPVALKKPTYLLLPPADPGSNLLIVGRSQDTIDLQDMLQSQNADPSGDIASNLLTIALLSLAAQYSPSEARFYILDFRSNVDDKRLEYLGKGLPHSVEVIHPRNPWSRGTTPRNPASIIGEMYNEVERRQKGGTGPLLFLLMYGLQWAYDLRPGEYLPTGALSPSNLARCFSVILGKGPEVGIHSLVLCDTFSNVKMSLEQGMWHQFDIGIAFHMAPSESNELLGVPVASELKENRALLFRKSYNYREKFIPYDLPLDNWFYQAITHIRSKK